MKEIITIAHGGGGTKTQQLIKNIIQKDLGNDILDQFDDSATLSINETKVAFTTDSYVVKPLFFPGGDIGKLAACGTLNDLTMQGAIPHYLSFALILEEGFLLEDLKKIVSHL